MTALPAVFPRVPLKQMDPSMLWFELHREADRLMPEAGELITSAATVASFLHRNQTRMVRGDMPRVPYIEHPLRVALRLVRWGVVDAELVVAALLHDVAEDCAEELVEVFGSPGDDAFDCLSRLYGERVAGLVEAVTNPTDGTTYLEHLKVLAGSASVALLIKASDLKDNAGSIKHQLGHGKDARLLRMLAKYLPVVPTIETGIGVVDDRLGGDDTPFARARLDLEELIATLHRLADIHDVEH